MKRERLPDIVGENTKIIFCGMAAGKLSCEMNHYYAKSGNKFWSTLNEVGFLKSVIVPCYDSETRKVNYELLIKNNIGLTDLVKNCCGMDGEIAVTQVDIDRLTDLIKLHQPTFIAFNGKKSAQKFLKKKSTRELNYGPQEGEDIGRTKIFVLPSTSSAAGRYWNIKHWRELYDMSV